MASKTKYSLVKSEDTLEEGCDVEEDKKEELRRRAEDGGGGVDKWEENKVRHWKESSYAVGLVEASWSDEVAKRSRVGEEGRGGCCADACSDEMEPTCGCLYLSGLVCSLLGARRLGNMAVLRESNETVVEDTEDSDEESHIPPLSPSPENLSQGKRRVSRRKIDIVVGPYWPMLVLLTYPLIFSVSLWTAVTALPNTHPLFVAFWILCTASLCIALFNTSCRDPGILPRRRTPNPNANWTWNDHAQTYRPRGAIYDPDCACVIEQFDHTCPWTGTAIGKKNMPSFQLFVALVFFCLIMDILLLTGAFVKI